ncbi:GNAT family N-acetyltransferase [Micromonospora sp. NPDC048830]|uniref:GNAT family N-acetyltransferase n=1 Tax=Micromonospora sp. NPDC048830 TaxID=3364257 RepID=UPI00371E4D5E
MTLPVQAPTVRPARPDDVPAVVAMVHELAEYERAPDQCHLTAEQLSAALFGPAPAIYGHVAVDDADRPLGFALWFLNFSTWAGGGPLLRLDRRHRAGRVGAVPAGRAGVDRARGPGGAPGGRFVVPGGRRARPPDRLSG